jgi:hypothetical protein
LDLGVRQNFHKWITEWNRRDAKKHGRVVVVETVAEADVVLARFLDRGKSQATIDTTLGSGLVYDPALGRLRAAPYARQYSYTEAPVFAYILTQTSPGSLEILWRYATTATVQERSNSGRQLWDDFKVLMKARDRAR